MARLLFRGQSVPILTRFPSIRRHPFPFIPNLGFSMGLQLDSKLGREPMTGLLRLPPTLDRFIRCRMTA